MGTVTPFVSEESSAIVRNLVLENERVNYVTPVSRRIKGLLRGVSLFRESLEVVKERRRWDEIQEILGCEIERCTVCTCEDGLEEGGSGR